MKINHNRWVELLQRTIQDNNWKALHPRFISDNSYFREMKDVIDYILGKDDLTLDERNIRDSIERHPDVWKGFQESASINFVKQFIDDPKAKCTEHDMKLFLKTYVREVKLDSFRERPQECDWNLLEMMADLIKRSDDDNMGLDKAFGLIGDVGHPTNNPYEVPECIRNMVKDMIEDYCTQAEAIRKEIFKPKTSTHEVDSYKRWFKQHKWTALNDYLFERFSKSRKHLDEKERGIIHKYWDKVDMPKTLEITVDTWKMLRVGKLSAKGEVIKAKDLH